MRCRLVCRRQSFLAALMVALLLPTLAISCRSFRQPKTSRQLLPPPETQPSPESIYLFREVLRLRITDDKVEGLGFYYFRNPDSVARAFPAALSFVIAAWQGPPRNLRLMHVSPDFSESLPFVWLEKNVPLADLYIPAGESYCLRVDWEQRLSDNHFVYRLRRQPPWNQRRDHVRLTLLVPRHLRDVRLNHRCSYEFKTESHRCFVLVCDDFDPAEDFVVTWEK